MNSTMLSVFIPTFFFVSLTPGMCMTLSMTMGMTIGVRRTFFMMAGELFGVGLVAATSVIGVAAVILRFPLIFTVAKSLGGLYLGYLGLQLWRSKGHMAVTLDTKNNKNHSPYQLALQGFITAIANPKGWAFFIALLPPFIDNQQPLAGQLGLLLSIILTIEFLCLVLYAGGGKSLNYLLQKEGNVQILNRIAGSLMIFVGVWLALS